ncbi:hypothetical protein ACTXGO_00895 [Psychrobacter sp. T6-1]|uniref:hypothetical protein n=1 Tax=Psychrobacter sp. T6-1 TaxID=3457447 RepID=UPI003FD3676C
MALFNILLAVGGMIGWFYVWFIAKYQTGCTARIQWGVMLIGLVFLSIFLADTYQGREPTSLSVLARLTFILAMYLLSPLLKVTDALLKKDET